MKRFVGLAFVLLGVSLAAAAEGAPAACTCSWRGPFVNMVPRSEYVVFATVKAHAGEDPEKPTAMDLEIHETFCGDELESPVRVYGDEGEQCRPPVTQFPVGSSWVLALNGPGSKPDPEIGPAISNCGQFWLEVKDDKLSGPFDVRKKDAEQTTTFAEFREKLVQDMARTWTDRRRLDFTGEVKKGKPFAQLFGKNFVFRLEPIEYGWRIVVSEAALSDDLSRLTPQRHYATSPLDIEGWQFQPLPAPAPDEGKEDEDPPRAPGEVRDFIFSPEVGKTIAGPDAAGEPSREDLHRVSQSGDGQVAILKYELEEVEEGEKAAFKSMQFRVRLSWAEPRTLGPGAPCSPKPKDSDEEQR